MSFPSLKKFLVGSLLCLLFVIGLAELYFSLTSKDLFKDAIYFNDPISGYRAVPTEASLTATSDTFINSYSMRSPAPPKDKCTTRILVLGDSVVFGVKHSNSELATTKLSNRLNSQSQNPVWVGNISAGNWAPNNILGYVNKFGFFDADAIVFVFNSHDITQSNIIDPNFIEGSFPTQHPSALLTYLDTKYGNSIRKRWHRFINRGDDYAPFKGASPSPDVIKELLARASKHAPTFGIPQSCCWRNCGS